MTLEMCPFCNIVLFMVTVQFRWKTLPVFEFVCQKLQEVHHSVCGKRIKDFKSRLPKYNKLCLFRVCVCSEYINNKNHIKFIHKQKEHNLYKEFYYLGFWPWPLLMLCVHKIHSRPAQPVYVYKTAVPQGCASSLHLGTGKSCRLPPEPEITHTQDIQYQSKVCI